MRNVRSFDGDIPYSTDHHNASDSDHLILDNDHLTPDLDSHDHATHTPVSTPMSTSDTDTSNKISGVRSVLIWQKDFIICN